MCTVCWLRRSDGGRAPSENCAAGVRPSPWSKLHPPLPPGLVPSVHNRSCSLIFSPRLLSHKPGAWYVNRTDPTFIIACRFDSSFRHKAENVLHVQTMSAAGRRRDQFRSKGAEERWKERDEAWDASDTRVLDVEAARRWDVMHGARWDGLDDQVPWNDLVHLLFEQESPSSKLPVHSSLELFCVPEDPAWPTSLWKQKGLRVKRGRRIPAQTLLGTYAGWIGYEEEYKALFPPVEAYGGNEAQWIKGNSKLASYTICCKHYSQLFPHPMGRLLIAAPGMGNWMAAINDGTWSPGSHEDVDMAKNRPPNVGFLEILHQGWPYMLVVTTRDVEAGEEILVDYGEEYWKEYLDTMTRAESCQQTNGG